MRLTPEEISYLRKEIRRIRESRDSYFEYMKNREIKASTGSEMIAIGDVLTEESYGRTFANYKAMCEMLSNSEYVREPSTDKIDIGTRFVVSYDGDDEDDYIILTEGGYGSLPTDTIVTTDSPLGKVVIGKKEGEPFEFTLGNDIRMSLSRRKITGTIKEIKTDPSCYLHFIRDRKYASRISRKNKNLFTELAQEDTEEAKACLDKWHEITQSQKEMLGIEIERLSRTKKTPQTLSRLAYIQELGKKSPIAPLQTDGTIGIGTRFELMTTDGETVTTNEYEMINRAISDELENEYIERISPLGDKIFGLKQNDEFEFVQNRKKYRGVITKVEVPEKSEELIYRYKK